MDYSGGHVFLNVFKMSGSFLRSEREKELKKKPKKQTKKNNTKHGIQGRETDLKTARSFWKEDEEISLTCCITSPTSEEEVNDKSILKAEFPELKARRQTGNMVNFAHGLNYHWY